MKRPVTKLSIDGLLLRCLLIGVALPCQPRGWVPDCGGPPYSFCFLTLMPGAFPSPPHLVTCSFLCFLSSSLKIHFYCKADVDLGSRAMARNRVDKAFVLMELKFCWGNKL